MSEPDGFMIKGELYTANSISTELVMIDYINELEAENAKLREVARAVVDTMRGSGNIDPKANEALRQLQILLEATSEPSHRGSPHE